MYYNEFIETKFERKYIKFITGISPNKVTMNLSKRSGDKELFTGERSSEVNTIKTKLK